MHVNAGHTLCMFRFIITKSFPSRNGWPSPSPIIVAAAAAADDDDDDDDYNNDDVYI